ncbi:MAG: PTS sugar transporter subunit IIC [Bacteroidales bacterium]|nr:PTS sugar transporter subunit IIC [Bacteroidales bacterium]
MFVQAVLLGLVACLGVMDGRWLGITMIDRPLVMCSLVGLVLGDLQAGVLIGASLELIFLGNVAIGAATPPDIVTGSIVACAFGILSGEGTEAALTLAIPIAVMASYLGVLVRIINAQFQHIADGFARKGDSKSVARIHVAAAPLYMISVFVPVFLSIMFGSDAVSAILNAIPVKITDGLKIASSLLPALGFALLINMMISKKLTPYFALGFLIAAYSGIDLIAVALIATCLAFIVSQLSGNNSNKDSGSNGESGDTYINENGIEVL